MDPKPELIRSEKETPGAMIHIDIERPGRIESVGDRIPGDRTGHRITGDRTGQSNPCARTAARAGIEPVTATGSSEPARRHRAVDAPPRRAQSENLPAATRKSGLRFLSNALRFFRSHGVRVWRVMPDNGVGLRSIRHANALITLKIKHNGTRPCPPGSKGKPERFGQPSLREWA